MKRILAMVICVALLATMAITGSVAYLTSEASAINTMVMGNVEIEQLEKDRDGNDFENNKPLYPAVYEGEKPEVSPDTGLWTGIVGAQDKIVSVKNTGESEAYVRTWFAFEADANNELKYIDINWNEEVTPVLYTEEGNSYVTIDRNNYVVYCVTYPTSLAVGDTTPASLLQVHMKPEADNDYVTEFGATYDILVFTQAGQVENMSTDPKIALNLMFDDEHPWDEGFKVETNDIVIRTAEDLRGLGGTSISENKRIVLANDIDMSDIDDMKTINIASTVEFDGQNHKISNLTLVLHALNSMTNMALFNAERYTNLTVKNLKFENATINAEKIGNSVTQGAAVVVSYVANNGEITLENVSVSNSTVTNNDGDAAVLVGHAQGGAQVEMTNCKVLACEVTGENKETRASDFTYNADVPATQHQKRGAFISTLGGSANVTVTNCTNGTNLPDYCRRHTATASYNGSGTKSALAISTKGQLLAFATGDGTATHNKNYTVVLTKDINMGGETLPAMSVACNGSLTFEGNGHTISNFEVGAGNYNGMKAYGMFYVHDYSQLTVNNLTIKNANVEAENSGYAAVIASYATTGKIALNNVKVLNSEVKNMNGNAAMLVGYTCSEVKLTNCTVSGTVTGITDDTEYNYHGAYVALANTSSCTVTMKNCTNSTGAGDIGKLLGGATSTNS